MWVRFPPRAHHKQACLTGNQEILAYLIGICLGDGNLSLLNNRTVRLRISCDLKYPHLIQRITTAIQTILPQNKVIIVRTPRQCINIVSYSTFWEEWLGWQADGGSKALQHATVPGWIKERPEYVRACLRGLVETDGSVYFDRGYRMINFTTIIFELACDAKWMITTLGYTCHTYKIRDRRSYKYIIRVSKNVDQFIQEVGIYKS